MNKDGNITLCIEEITEDKRKQSNRIYRRRKTIRSRN